MRCIIFVYLKLTATATTRDGDPSTPNCVSTGVAAGSARTIYQHYLTNYKRNLIYPVIFLPLAYVCIKIRNGHEEHFLIAHITRAFA